MNHIEKVKEILKTINFVSMATVNEDGSPHNSPLVFLYDQNFEYIYWGSHPESQHSQNILRTGQAFFVAYDGIKGKHGVYIQTAEALMVEGEELKTALEVHNRFRAKLGKKAITIEYYQGNNPQRMWRAKIEKVWVNEYDRDENGLLKRDFKVEVEPGELK